MVDKLINNPNNATVSEHIYNKASSLSAVIGKPSASQP